MKLNGITDKISSDGGDYLVLADHGAQGLGVWSQWKTLDEAIAAAMKISFSSTTIVKLCSVEEAA